VVFMKELVVWKRVVIWYHFNLLINMINSRRTGSLIFFRTTVINPKSISTNAQYVTLHQGKVH
jgi:hypothetical protein